MKPDPSKLQTIFGRYPAPLRQVYMRLYRDAVLQRDMLLRVIVEETVNERVVITAYKTSQIGKYLEGGTK